MLLLALQFGSPNASFIPTVAGDPARFLPADPSFVVEFPVGDGPSNPHMSLEFNGEVFVPDLVCCPFFTPINHTVFDDIFSSPCSFFLLLNA